MKKKIKLKKGLKTQILVAKSQDMLAQFLSSLNTLHNKSKIQHYSNFVFNF